MSAARRAARALALGLVAAVVVVGAGSPVAAHGGAAEITVVDALNDEPSVVDFTVEVHFVLDGHPAVPATFVASGVGPDGTIVDARNLEPTGEEGVYEVSVEFPATGNWTVTFQSSLPPGELDYDLIVGSDVAPPVTAQSDDTGEANAASAPPGAGETATVTSEGSGPPLVLLAGLAAAALVGVVAVAFVVRAGRRRATDS